MAARVSPRSLAAWRRPDGRPIAEWAAEHLTFPMSYAIPGRFDVSITRPLIDVFAAIQNPLVRRVRFRGPPRFGKSLINDVAIPWVVCNDPGPIMWNWQKDDAALEHMREKAWPLWRSCAPFLTMLPKGRHEITTTEIYFGPFFLKVQGANPNNLQGKGIRWLFNEEIWLPVWQSLYNQAVARTRDYARNQSEKVVDVSQAGNSGDVESRNWDEGHQARWCYRSPIDGKHYPLVMHGKRPDGSRYGLIWADDARRADGTINLSRAIETARYVCQETGYTWQESPATIAEWNRDGMYLPQNPTAPADIRSFSVPALLNNTFADLIRRKVSALHQASTGDMTGLRDCKQQDESLPWSEEHLTVTITGSRSVYLTDPAHALDPNYLDGTQPLPGERYRTLMADRQKGMAGDTPHRWCEIRAWFSGGESKQLHFGRVDTKESMRDLQQRYKVPDRCTWQDARFEPHLVYEECAEFGWIACFGSNQGSWSHILPNPAGPHLPPVKVRLPYSPWQKTVVAGKDVFYLLFSSDYAKDILANLLAGRGVAHAHPDDVLPAYVEHLKAEHKILKAGKYTWEKVHGTKANHGFDTSVQGICFALLMKLLSMPKKLGDDSATATAPSSAMPAPTS